MTKLIFIRHGESEANGKGVFAGHLDMDLSEKGFRQAELTAQYVQAHFQVDTIYASDLSRAYHTAQNLAKRLNKEIITSENLREIFAGEWQGLTFTCLQTTYEKEYGVWLQDIGNAVPTGGESVRALSERVWKEVQRIQQENEGKTVVIATHATPIRVLLCRLLGFDIAELKNVPWVSNSSLTVVDVENGIWRIQERSFDAHLSGLQTSFPANV